MLVEINTSEAIKICEVLISTCTKNDKKRNFTEKYAMVLFFLLGNVLIGVYTTYTHKN